MSIFMAAVGVGHTLCCLGLNEYENRQEHQAEKVVKTACLSLTAALIPLYSNSLKHQVECFLSEKVIAPTCVKMMLHSLLTHRLCNRHLSNMSLQDLAVGLSSLNK